MKPNAITSCSSRTLFPSFFAIPSQQHHSHVSIFLPKSKTPALFHCSLSSSPSPTPTPPSTKEEAILQAKTSLSSTLEKPLNNNNPKLPGKLKKLKQPRFRVEIPVIDDSPSSLSQLALDVFGKMPIRRKPPKINILILWPNSTLASAAAEAFQSSPAQTDVRNVEISSDSLIVESRWADLVVFLAAEASELGTIKAVTESAHPKPAVLFNPKWGFEEEGSLDESGFLGSFEVVYSFMGLEVRGILSKRRGVVFKCVRDGVVSGERWNVLVEEENGEMKVVSSFKARPSITQVENVLYNLMAINSPITKSAKFFKDLVSNVTGRK